MARLGWIAARGVAPLRHQSDQPRRDDGAPVPGAVPHARACFLSRASGVDAGILWSLRHRLRPDWRAPQRSHRSAARNARVPHSVGMHAAALSPGEEFHRRRRDDDTLGRVHGDVSPGQPRRDHSRRCTGAEKAGIRSQSPCDQPRHEHRSGPRRLPRDGIVSRHVHRRCADDAGRWCGARTHPMASISAA
jgi:hypothetical protein